MGCGASDIQVNTKPITQPIVVKEINLVVSTEKPIKVQQNPIVSTPAIKKDESPKKAETVPQKVK